MIESDIDAYFAQFRRDAILLHRPYPPHDGPPTNSKFGGLPRLPADYAWPRDKNNAPLHFLAQIDCADIKVATPLPDRGVLFFFGRDDDEQIWDADNAPGRSTSVIYALDAFARTPLRDHPSDLGPIGGTYFRAKAWQNLLLKDEDGPRVHVEWPILPLRIDSWPDTLFDEPANENGPFDWLQALRNRLQRRPQPSWEDEQKRYEAYAYRHQILRAAAFARATGKPILPWNAASDGRDVAERLFERANCGPEAFPHFWIQIEYAARTFIGNFGGSPSHPIYDEQQLPTALAWLDRARAADAAAAVGDPDKASFRRWLMTLEKPLNGPKRRTPYAQCVFHAVRLNIRSWARDPALSAKIASFAYAEMEPHMSGNSVWGLQYSQMLGHAPSAQEPLHPDDPTLCLLNLASDPVLGWMFGDVGNATFYSPPDALARRDFADVAGEVVGH
ncbi:MAG TPA: DUF1963 domain-containing protein [Sphingopyxis sp.]|jgi:hypothetical protein|uniref:DUF1963 domain-containing protein n=1 Tax=Sphingopyxis sp. TaxID=1908224 RepID=UPI002E158D93|nr:DUF1963 domain-containing protein [Sphingopyxis sp.]